MHVVSVQDNRICLTQLKKETVELNAPPTDKLVATQLKGPDDTPAVLRTHLFVYSLLPFIGHVWILQLS